MIVEQFKHTTRDGASLHVYHWRPDYEIGRGVIHIVHGLAEHAGRYERFAEALTDEGYQVFAHDQRGHGQTAASPEDLGFVAEKDGWNLLVGDTIELCRAEKARFPKLPIYLFSHSMGTYIAQQIIYQEQQLLDAVIMSGPSGEVGPLVHFGKLIARIERWRLSARGRSDLINRLSFDGYNREFAPNRTAFDWLSRDESAVDRYINDPFCGFIATTQFWVDFLDAIVEIARKENRERIRRDLPIYMFTGRNDPVNNQGRGSELLAETYRGMGIRNVSYHGYSQARHETLNEINREEVLGHVIEWLDCLKVHFSS